MSGKIGGCLQAYWKNWEDLEAPSFVVNVIREGYRIPMETPPPLSPVPIPFSSYQPASEKGMALQGEILDLVEKGAVEPAPLPSPGYYSLMFVVKKASGGWRPIIDLSHLNKFVKKTKFKMETVKSTLESIREGDWMFSLDLKDAYLQIPIHEDSRHLLRFCWNQKVWQFKALCFGLTTAPQIYTKVLAPVATFLHAKGIRMLRYLDDWLFLSRSLEEAIHSREIALDLCHHLGIRINWKKSNLSPKQRVTYLGMSLSSTPLRAFPTPERIKALTECILEFVRDNAPPAKLWLRLIGILSSLMILVPGGRRRIRNLQFNINRLWDRKSDFTRIPLNDEILQDLAWWLETEHHSCGISLEEKVPEVVMFSDASNVGWGATIAEETISGRWNKEEEKESINWQRRSSRYCPPLLKSRSRN